MLTGDPKRDVFTNPYFFGKEEVYLRAQIARISHSTQLCPRSGYRFDNPEEEPRAIVPDLDDDTGALKVIPTPKDMCNPAAWAHENEGILEQARVDHIIPAIPEELGEIDEEVWKAQQIAKDPFDERLGLITADR